MDFLAKLKNLIRYAKVTGPADNTKEFPVQQVTFKGKTADTYMVFPYGMYANADTQNSVAVLFSVDGNDDNRAAIPSNPQNRPTDLAEGEVAIYHPNSGACIKLRASGDIEITTEGNIAATCADLNATASGDANVTSTGDTNVTAANVNVDASVTNLGVGGLPIARAGDPVSVTITSGSSAGVATGTITSGGDNTSI